MSSETLTFILAYQRGESLGTLTEHRPQAAVPFGGEYRIVDFCLSNVLHSGLRQIYIATQYRSRSLHAHLRSGWSVFSPELGQFIEPLPPQMKSGQRWYEGAVDVLMQNLDLIEQSDAETVLLLNGNAVYRMDYAALLETHHKSGAAATVTHCTRRALDSNALDWLEIDDAGTVRGLRSSRGSDQLRAVSDQDMEVEVGIGVVAFKRQVLLSRLAALAKADEPAFSLGRDLLCDLIAQETVKAYQFGGKRGRVTQDRFWSPISSIEEFFTANMALLEPVAPLDLYQFDWPIWSSTGRNPPARTVSSRQGNEGIFVNSIVSNGTVIEGGAVTRSVLCPRVRVEDSAVLEQCILFEGVHVGEGAQLRNCIVDKRARIPAGVQIGFDPKEDARQFEVTGDGIVVVPMDYGAESANPGPDALAHDERPPVMAAR